MIVVGNVTIDTLLKHKQMDAGLDVLQKLGYLEFLHLNMQAKMVLTDSGGLQEETTVLGVPCISMRHNTERPITCEVGTNTIVGNDPEKILSAAQVVLDGQWRRGGIPEKWDEHAADRIVEWLVGSHELHEFTRIEEMKE